MISLKGADNMTGSSVELFTHDGKSRLVHARKACFGSPRFSGIPFTRGLVRSHGDPQ